jgi:hypothetical protein
MQSFARRESGRVVAWGVLESCHAAARELNQVTYSCLLDILAQLRTAGGDNCQIVRTHGVSIISRSTATNGPSVIFTTLKR